MVRSKLLDSLRRQNAGERREPAPRREGARPRLLAENVRAWDILMDAFIGRQFLFGSRGVFGPMGGGAIGHEVIAFDYKAVIDLIELKVPAERRREVFEKFRWVEQYALQAVMVKREGAGGGKNTHTASAAQRRRNRRRS